MKKSDLQNLYLIGLLIKHNEHIFLNLIIYDYILLIHDKQYNPLF